MNSEYSEAISEVLEILQYLEDDLLNKIPLDVIKGLKKYSSKTDKYKFINTKGVITDKVSEKAKDIFAVLYRRYIGLAEKLDKILPCFPGDYITWMLLAEYGKIYKC